MDSFEKWRREVNIILHDIVDISLTDMEVYIEDNIKLLYEDGAEPIDGAQYAVEEIKPMLNIEQILLDRTAKATRFAAQKRKNTFEEETDED